MANLDTNEKQVLEKLLQMSGGGVLNFTNRTMILVLIFMTINIIMPADQKLIA
jgi:predicted flavoprotein YhiN